jgi:hypothetical protein
VPESPVPAALVGLSAGFPNMVANVARAIDAFNELEADG